MTSPLLVVVGRSGQVGNALARVAARDGLQLTSIGRHEVDLTRPTQGLAAALDRHVGQAASVIVVNAAAYTAVDAAETDAETCHLVNCVGPAAIAQECRARGFTVVHLSSDYVFDGHQTAPYQEDDPVGAISVYGRSKLDGDNAIRRATDAHVILRTAWLYSPFGTNFVKTMLRLGGTRAELRVVDDQWGCPTAAGDVAEAIVAIAGQLAAGKRDGYGTFHYCGQGACTWFALASEIFRLAAAKGLPVPRCTPIPSSSYPTAARRPANSVLDCSKIRAVYGIDTRPWQQSLVTCIEDLLMAQRTAP